MRLEIRCCCQPTKLLGYLKVTESEIAAGRVIRHRLRSAFDGSWRSPFPEKVPLDRVELPIEEIVVDGKRYDAIKAEGMKVEDLRLMFGFEEKRA